MLQFTCQKIINGGQTGVDRGVLDACLSVDFPCEGWCPSGRRAEDGRIDMKYPLTETETSSYDTRTRLNVRDSDGTLIISPVPLTGGTLLTMQAAHESGKPYLVVSPDFSTMNETAERITDWLNKNRVTVLNIAGPRESEWKQGYSISVRLTSKLLEKFQY